MFHVYKRKPKSFTYRNPNPNQIEPSGIPSLCTAIQKFLATPLFLGEFGKSYFTMFLIDL